jgi:hypothetical protein
MECPIRPHYKFRGQELNFLGQEKRVFWEAVRVGEQANRCHIFCLTEIF